MQEEPSAARDRVRSPIGDLLRVLVVLLVAALVGCASTRPPPVLSAPDLSGYRTWSWQEGAPSVLVPPEEAAALQALLAESLERGLAERGYQQVARGGDFTVGARLQVLLVTERGYEAMAPRALWSHHASPSYWIEGSRPVERRVRQLSLSLVLRTPEGDEISTGAERRLVKPDRALPVADLVAGMLAPIEPSTRSMVHATREPVRMAGRAQP